MILPWLVLLLRASSALLVTLDNVNPRLDQYGHILNAHDGSVTRFINASDGTAAFNGLYFMAGTVYENCTQHGSQCSGCGYSPNTFALYTTADLVHFTLATPNLLPEAAKDNAHVDYWMPVIFFNPTTAQYVLQYWSGRCGFVKPCADIAVAASPYGPFTMVPPLQLHGGTPSSQMGFFVDPDTHEGYVKYNTGAPQHHVVEKLAPDWLSTTGEWAIVFWKPSFAWMEGGGMFKRGGLFYYMTGTDCCFCTWGGDARYWTARSALGPWHPGLAPPLPTAPCDLSGQWQSLSSGGMGNESLTLRQAPGSNVRCAASSQRARARGRSPLHPLSPPPPTTRTAPRHTGQNFTFSDAHGSAAGWVDPATGYVTFPPSAGDGRGVVTSADGRAAGCDRIRWYGYESFIWCRVGADCPLPSYADAPELNYCADGSLPHEDVRVNPCDPQVEYGVNFTVPAQQFNVIGVATSSASGAAETTWLYYGERANSAPDRLFSHNFQAWVPMSFDAAGAIQRLTFPATFELNLTNATA